MSSSFPKFQVRTHLFFRSGIASFFGSLDICAMNSFFLPSSDSGSSPDHLPTYWLGSRRLVSILGFPFRSYNILPRASRTQVVFDKQLTSRAEMHCTVLYASPACG